MDGRAIVSIRDPRLDPLANLDWRERLELLRARIAPLGRVVVAYSGGVDSSVVLRVAHEQLGARALGVIGRSDSYALRELELALAQAAEFGAASRSSPTGELSNPRFRGQPVRPLLPLQERAVPPAATLVAARFGAAAVLDGTIADDSTDHRPGRRAAEERRCSRRSPSWAFARPTCGRSPSTSASRAGASPPRPASRRASPTARPSRPRSCARVERAEEALRALGFDRPARAPPRRRGAHRGAARRPAPGCSSRPLRDRVVAGLEGRRAIVLFRSTSRGCARAASIARLETGASEISWEPSPGGPGTTRCAPTEAAAHPAIFAEIVQCPGPRQGSVRHRRSRTNSHRSKSSALLFPPPGRRENAMNTKATVTAEVAPHQDAARGGPRISLGSAQHGPARGRGGPAGGGLPEPVQGVHHPGARCSW